MCLLRFSRWSCPIWRPDIDTDFLFYRYHFCKGYEGRSTEVFREMVEEGLVDDLQLARIPDWMRGC